MEIIIYGKKDGCPKCVNAKKLSEMRNIEYKYFIIGEDITVEKLMEKVGRVVREAPVIFDGETFIGGFEDYISYLSRGQ